MPFTDLRQLRTFVAVAEERNFTRAAERLFLGQQAVSKSVRQLELALGFDLLERTTHDVRLTAAGEALLEGARPLLREADAVFDAVQAVGGGRVGSVAVGVTPAIAADERHRIVDVLRAGADVGVSLRQVEGDALRTALVRGELDVAVVRVVAERDGLDVAVLGETPLAVFVAADHRLARRATIAVGELDGERLLTWGPPGTPFTDLLLAALEAAGVRLEPVRSRASGDRGLDELVTLGAVAVMPAGWSLSPGVVRLTLTEAITLPLLAVSAIARPAPAARRLREGWSPGG
jgi:DNA-binding transcriptional LysR family regulator